MATNAYAKLLENYIKENPYPTYEEMEERISHNAVLYSEYGKMHHEYCKAIYENSTNKDLIVQMGKRIFNLGGMQALQANYNILRYFTPFSESDNSEIRSWGKIIEFYFMDVTPKWMA